MKILIHHFKQLKVCLKVFIVSLMPFTAIFNIYLIYFVNDSVIIEVCFDDRISLISQPNQDF